MLSRTALDDSGHLLQKSVGTAVRTGDGGQARTFSPTTWKRIADTGVFALGTEEGGGGPSDIAAAHEAMGREAVLGPLVATVLAIQLVDGDQQTAIAAGNELMGLRIGDLVTWAPPALTYLELEHDRAWSCELDSVGPAVGTMAGEPWSRSTGKRLEELSGMDSAVAIADLATAAYLIGAGTRLLEMTVAHAIGRRQFGRSIGDFQAVAHPLARCEAQLTTARQLLYLTALELEQTPVLAGGSCMGTTAAVHIAEDAALSTSFSAHQVHGALGFTEEAFVGTYSTRIRQISLGSAGRIRTRLAASSVGNRTAVEPNANPSNQDER